MTTEPVRTLLIERTIDALTADYERQDGRLEKKQVDRTLEKRGLSVAECQAVLDHFDRAGIRLDDPDDDDDPSAFWHLADGEAKEDPLTVLEQYTSAAPHRRADEYKLLSGPEELELGRVISMGQRAAEELLQGAVRSNLHDSLIAKGNAAQSKMTLANLRLVAHVARPFFGMSDLTADDLIQEGILGLIRATQKFDHTLGLRFSTYATWWIRQAVTRAIADRGATIRVPVYLTWEVHRYRRAFRLLHQAKPTRNPTLSELADELVWPIDRVAFIQHLSMLQPTSLDEPVAGALDVNLIDLVAAEAERPDESAERNSLRNAVASALAGLTENERRVLNLRFGLEDESGGRTLEEVGQQLGVTRERVRQIESKALGRLLNRAKRRTNYSLSAYCPSQLLKAEGASDADKSPHETGDKPAKKKEKERKSRKAAARAEPEPFPREYRWLR
ncbi:sigma-70 family RNA polymerase sigma factor [Ralstonia pseudosolanacearum]|uniref:sigma-70 family RNA polymerase sigma factor n=2 Tax=Ralstonia pseudosolanacearum TaxID=1310165 RepID=UPI0009C0AE70|nr:sigma-70 family RNA polymerase sigma factor [Ralstonia pseudosolanacearum]MDC6295117.1 sigma-70 family RNA polymerase sigma factor [Ralstonia pseudosolanacearum]MDD7789497.1 sigma-70 family RNA polymerase sigma factor [Ralstonia pseudosolanacearum]MDN3370049.1 sigma-70 family RNA polymerase sigma factor [Ralstonia pseudosolanacearum]QOK85159.1 sigma-70 family RNA polymerase sigma factor [Ralstonia pseudosolanacearum]